MRGQFSTRHKPSGMWQALPWACAVRPLTVMSSRYSRQYSPVADPQVRVGVIAPALPVSGLRRPEGMPFGRVSGGACGVRAEYSRPVQSREAPISLFEYIEIFYNRRWLHLSISYRMPAQPRRDMAIAQAAKVNNDLVWILGQRHIDK